MCIRDIIFRINRFILKGNWSVYRSFVLMILCELDERFFSDKSVDFDRCS